MRLAFSRPWWLAVFLLLATLSSAPAGSMEQDRQEMSGVVLERASVPSVRLAPSELELLTALAPDGTGERWSSSNPVPSEGFGALETNHLQAIGGLMAPADPESCVRICERLPYHPNAPPRST